MKNVKNWKKQSREQRQTPSATQENKQIKNELLKTDGPNLVDASHEVIQQARTSETLSRSWTEGVLCPLYKKGDKLDCKNYLFICFKNYRGICLLNVTYKVFAKILYDRLLPHGNAAV
jgi:hypothetical protein